MSLNCYIITLLIYVEHNENGFGHEVSQGNSEYFACFDLSLEELGTYPLRIAATYRPKSELHKTRGTASTCELTVRNAKMIVVGKR